MRTNFDNLQVGGHGVSRSVMGFNLSKCVTEGNNQSNQSNRPAEWNKGQKAKEEREPEPPTPVSRNDCLANGEALSDCQAMRAKFQVQEFTEK